MRVIIAPDSFKGSISAIDAAEAIERGIKRHLPHCETIKIPIADGGEGTIDSLLAAAGGQKIKVTVSDPLGRPVEATYAQLNQQHIAVIEMAEASGLTLVATEERNPLLASTYGTGQLIKQALDDGCRNFILGLGGSATNDGGAGMLQALGMRLLDAEGNEVKRGGGQLKHIASIDVRDLDKRIAESQFLIASDVQNPLLGADGATHTFGPQKGATPAMIEELEDNMTAWADLIEQATGSALHTVPGTGAAGGICAALLAFFPATIQRGIDVVLQFTNMDKHLAGAQLVITGEGQIDAQTISGKTPMGVAQQAKKYNVPTIALAGSVGTGFEQLYDHGINAVYSIVNRPMTLQEAMDDAAALLEYTAEQVIRTIHL